MRNPSSAKDQVGVINYKYGFNCGQIINLQVDNTFEIFSILF